jgi:hypothetical protein
MTTNPAEMDEQQEPATFHSLPPELLIIIADWMVAIEVAENKRLLPSEHRMCDCGDEEQERAYRMREQGEDLSWHSGILKLSSLSRHLRSVLFDNRKIRGVSIPFYVSALDKLTDISDRLKEDVRQVALTSSVHEADSVTLFCLRLGNFGSQRTRILWSPQRTDRPKSSSATSFVPFQTSLAWKSIIQCSRWMIHGSKGN